MGKARSLGSGDTRVLLVGLAVFVALLAYLAVGFANTHATPLSTQVIASTPFVPYASNLAPIPSRTGAGFVVRVTPVTVGNYGALAQTLVSLPPPGRRFVLNLWLRGSRAGGLFRSQPGRIAIFVNEPGLHGASALSVIKTTVPATSRWHRFVFTRVVEGPRLSIALYINRNTYSPNDVSSSWFEFRDVTVKFH